MMMRKQQGMTQAELGRRLGLTFQQIQKYEHGLNKLSASRLAEISLILKTPIGYFYRDFLGDEEEEASPAGAKRVRSRLASDLLLSRESAVLLSNYQSIREQAVRRLVLDMIRSLGKRGGDDRGHARNRKPHGGRNQ